MPTPETDLHACPMCGSTAGPENWEMSSDPAVLKPQIDRLHERWLQIQAGEIGPEEMQEMLPELCGLCRSILSYRDAWDAAPGELQRRVSHELERLQTRLFAVQGLGQQAPPPDTDEQGTFLHP